MGAKRYSASYLKSIGIDPHDFKSMYGIKSECDIEIDSNSGEIILVVNKTNQLIPTGEYVEDYENDENLNEEN